MTDAEAHLLGPAEIRALAEELDVSPTKKLGQNFVHDPNTVRRIVAAGDVTLSDHVIEVGPGLGSLTVQLLATARQVTAVEIDPRLAARLPQTVAERAQNCADRLTVVNKDALTVTPEDVGESTPPSALVANLPYNVSVPVLLHILDIFPSIERVLVMVQAEVADRLAAGPGSKVYGVPSVKASFYGKVSLAGNIGRRVFWPEPNVDSKLVRIDRYDPAGAPWPRELKRDCWPLIDAAFAQRRKTLRAALSGHYGSAAAGEKALRQAGIDPQQRGEKLDVADFVRLAQTGGVDGRS